MKQTIDPTNHSKSKVQELVLTWPEPYSDREVFALPPTSVKLRTGDSANAKMFRLAFGKPPIPIGLPSDPVT